MKYLGAYLQSRKDLIVNMDCNSRKFPCASFTIVQRIEYLSEEICCYINLAKCLPILTYGSVLCC